jgi:hypothetical protein
MSVIKTNSTDSASRLKTPAKKEDALYLVILEGSDGEFVSSYADSRKFSSLQEARDFLLTEEDPDGVSKSYIVEVKEVYTAANFHLEYKYG